MTFWVLHAMLLVRRIEVASRRREARGIALIGFVDVDGVNSRTEICNVTDIWSPPGQPACIPTRKPKAKRDTPLGGATAPKEVNHQRNHRYDQQQVNQPTRNVEGEKS